MIPWEKLGAYLLSRRLIKLDSGMIMPGILAMVQNLHKDSHCIGAKNPADKVDDF